MVVPPSMATSSTARIRAPLSELSLAPFIFAAHNARNISDNEVIGGSSSSGSGSSSSPLRKHHGPSPILKPTSLGKRKTPEKRAVVAAQSSHDLDAEGDVTITRGSSSSSSSSLSQRSAHQPTTPPDHSTAPKNLRPHHPHVYSSASSPIIVGAASPSLTVARRGPDSSLKQSSSGNGLIDHPRDAMSIPVVTTPSPSASSALTSKSESNSLPRKRHRVQPGEAAMAKQAADRPFIGTPSPHKLSAPPASHIGQQGARSSSMLTRDVSVTEARLQLADDDLEEGNPFRAHEKSGDFVVFEDPSSTVVCAQDLKMESSPVSIEEEEGEDKENVRIDVAAPEAGATATRIISPAISPERITRPGTVPLQRPRNVKGSRPPSTISFLGESASSSSSSSSTSTESGSSFFASSTASSGAEVSSVAEVRSARGSGEMRTARRAGEAKVAASPEAAREVPKRKGTGGRLSLLASASPTN